MSEGLNTVHVAHKRHICDWGCGDLIEPGTSYVRSAHPPGRGPNYANHWVTYRGHGGSLYDCPRYASDAGARSVDQP